VYTIVTGKPKRNAWQNGFCQEISRFQEEVNLRPSTTLRILLGAASFLVVSATSASGQSQHVEDVYVARSTRISNTIPPTAFCNSAPFKAMRESYLTFSSVETRPEDGRLSNPAVKTIGHVKTCGGTLEPQDSSLLVTRLYTEGTIAGVPFKGIGSCQIQANLPENGISQLRCFQALSGLPSEYAGGVLLNSAIISQTETGAVSSPPGYLQSGIATFRLWKKRVKPIK
jgi:hypothetical protein